jgi:hypothetical protein
MSEQLNYRQVLADLEAKHKERAERMPTEKDAIRVMFDAYQRLKELGWRDGMYMPPSGERFAGISNGSTGIHAYYARTTDGSSLPRKMYEIHDGDIWPTSTPPVLFRAWRDDDVQQNLPICAPIPVGGEP